MFKSPMRIYLTPDDRLSAEPITGGSLLVGANSEIDDVVAKRYGVAGFVAGYKAAPAEESGSPEAKLRDAIKTPANKARKGTEDKGEAPQE